MSIPMKLFGEVGTTKSKGYELAKSASLNSDFYKCHTGVVAIYGNKVLTIGWNSEKLSTMQARYNTKTRGFDGHKYKSSIHAEMMVVNKIKYLDVDFSQVRYLFGEVRTLQCCLNLVKPEKKR